MAKIMISSVGRRSYLVRSLLNSAGHADQVVVTDSDQTAPALWVPGVSASFLNRDTLQVAEYCRRHHVDALISLHDFETLELLERKADFPQTLLIGPSATTAKICLDKLALSAHLETSAPLHMVPTFDWCSFSGGAEVHWVVKDRYGSASSGLQIGLDSQETRAALSESRGRLVAQPMLTGPEFNVDLFFSAPGHVLGACAKRKLRMRAGETDAAEVMSSPPPGLVEAAIASMHGLEVIGNVDIDLIKTPTGWSTIDVNPRFGGGYAFSLAAGFDVGEAVWSMARREVVDQTLTARGLLAAKVLEVVACQA